MDIKYDLEADTISIFAIDGETMRIPEFMNLLPKQIAMDYHLIYKIHKNREFVVNHVGDYNVKIVELNEKIAGWREKLEGCNPKTDKDEIKFYKDIIHQIGKHVTAMKELRHGTKLNAIWEGKLMAELAGLEV